MSYLECANGCTIRDQHLDTCTDETCGGCLPKPAQVGCLCGRDWYALEVAWSEWAILEPFLAKYARLSPRNDDGGRSPSGPSIPLPQTLLSWDEVRSWLRSEPQDARSWVSTVDGAIQAVGFTRAVQRAARAHQIEERTRQLQRMRCPSCSQIVAWMPPRFAGNEVSSPFRYDADFIAVSRTAMPLLLAAVESVLALHTPTYPMEGPDVACFHCAVPATTGKYTWVPWPCLTVRAITDALGGGDDAE